MSCSKEVIEKKRLAAIQKRRSKIGLQNAPKLEILKELYHNTRKPPESVRKVNISHEDRDFNRHTSHMSPDSNVLSTKIITGSTYLISDGRFEVNLSEFCPPLINIFKSLCSKNYDPKSKLWNFSIDEYEELMSRAAELAPAVALDPIPPYVMKVARAVMPASADLNLALGPALRARLLPFQEEAVRYAVARRGRVLLADDMGLGKTLQALAVAAHFRADWPLLVVTTTSMREAWREHAQSLLPALPLPAVLVLGCARDAPAAADPQTEMVIASYKVTATHLDMLKAKKFGVVIVDESHNVKSRKARCTGALRSLCCRAKRVLLLSGTPALSRPAELYSQLALLEPGLFPSFVEYARRYCDARRTAFGWDTSGQSHLAELQVLLHKRFLIRRTKDQVLPDLEEKTREVVVLDPAPAVDVGSDDLVRAAAAHGCAPPAARHAALLTFFSETAKAKIPAVCEYIRQLVRATDRAPEKFLVFAHHKCMIDAIALTLDEEHVPYVCIVGATPPAQRADLVARFQAGGGGVRAGVLSLTAAGAGITLTAADLVLFAELHWNPGVLTQAESRAHRLGRRGVVCARYLLARGTADDRVWPLLRAKLEVLNAAGLSRDEFVPAPAPAKKSTSDVTQYLSFCGMRDENDYIPGTNIRRGAVRAEEQVRQAREEELQECGADVAEFLRDNEGDDLLATLDLL